MLQVKHEQANVQYRKNRIFLETLQTKTQLYKVHYFLTGSIGELLIASPHSMTVDQKVDKTWPHKYKDKDNDKDNDKDKDTDKVPEKPNICYIFEILMTYSFQIWW